MTMFNLIVSTSQGKTKKVKETGKLL